MAGSESFYELINKKIEEEEQPAASGGAASFYALVNSKLGEQKEQTPATASASDYPVQAKPVASLALPTPEEWAAANNGDVRQRAVDVVAGALRGARDYLTTPKQAQPVQTAGGVMALPTPEEWANRNDPTPKAVKDMAGTLQRTTDRLEQTAAAKNAEKTPTVQTGKGKAEPGAAGGGGRGRATEADAKNEARSAWLESIAFQPTSDMYLNPRTAEAAETMQDTANAARARAAEKTAVAEALKPEVEKQREKVEKAHRELLALAYTNNTTEGVKAYEEKLAEFNEENQKLHEMGGRYGLKEDAETVGENLVAGLAGAGRGLANAAAYAGQEITRGQLMEQQSVISGLPGQKEIADSSGKLLEDMQQRGLQSFAQQADTLGLEGLAKADKSIQDFTRRAAEHSSASGKVTKAMAATANGVGGMIPSILVNLAAPGTGLWTMMAQAAGNATEEALEAGAQDEKAVLYGLAVGGVEALTEKITGGIPGLNVGALDDVAEGLVKKALQSGAAQKAAMLLFDALGEGFEEFISEFADYGLNRWLVKTDGRSLAEVNKDAWYAGLIGALTSLAMKLPADAIKAMSPKELARAAADETVERVEANQAAEDLKLPDPESLSQNEKAAPNGTAEDLALPTPGESKGAVAIEDYQRKERRGEILDVIRDNLQQVEEMEPVKSITGNEFQKSEADKRPLREKVIEFFNSIGNKVTRKDIGDIELNDAGAHDSTAHGYGKLKAATFAALPEVLKDGKIVKMRGPYEGHNYNSAFIVAPVNVGTETCYVGALVIQDDKTQRYKLHEVLVTNRNGAPLFKSGSDVNAGPPRNGAPLEDRAGPPAKNVAQPAQDVKTGLELPAVPVQEQAAERDLSLPAVPTQQAGGQAVEVRALPTPEEWANRNDTQRAKDLAELEELRREETLEEEQARREAEAEEYRQARVEAAAEELPTDAANMSDGGYSLNGYAASPGLRKLGVKIAEPITSTIGGDVLLNYAQKARKAEQALNKAIRKLAPTKAEKTLAKGLADGTYTEGGGILYGKDGTFLKDVNMGKVRELAEYYRQKEQYKEDRVANQRRRNRSRESDTARELLKGADTFKKMGALRLNMNTPKRNMLAWAGQELGAKINRHLFDPVERNSVERIRFAERMKDRVRDFHLTKGESAMVQRVIEGTAVQDQVAKLTADSRRRVNAAAESADFELTAAEYNLTKEERDLARRFKEWQQTKEDIKDMDADKINAAAKAYTDAYSDFYTAINEFLVMHGYEPIGFIEGYAPHLQPDRVQTTLGKVLSAFGMDAEVSALPTDIAGRTESFKPGHQWNPYFQHRAGADALIDAVAGYESYLEYMSNVLFHTDDIQKLRIFANELRSMYADEEIREKLDQAKWLMCRSAEEKLDFLRINGEIGEGTNLSPEDAAQRVEDYIDKLYGNIENNTMHGDVVSWLDDYTNKLAGKQTKLDRSIESRFGRKAINAGNALSRTFGESAVVGNLSSALNQLAQLPAVQTEVGNKYVLQAITDILRGKTGDMDTESDFLTGKLGSDSLLKERSWSELDAKQKRDRVTEKMSIPFEAVDMLASRVYVRAKYLQEIANGKSHQEAMRSADDFVERVVGNRIQGSRPMAFEDKNAISKLLTTFQLEVANAWAHISQDLPAEIKEIAQTQGKAAAVKRTAEILLRHSVSAFLLNRLAETIYGGTPAPFDILGYVLGGLAAGNGETVNQYLVELVGSLLGFGGDKDDEDKEFDAGAALKEAGNLVVGDLPYVRNAASLLGYGDTTLPLPKLDAVYKVPKAAVKGIAGTATEKDVRDAVESGLTWLPGGSQIKKSGQGSEVLYRKGRYDSQGNLMYPVDFSGAEGAAKAAKAIAFGRSSLGATDAYFASGDRALSKAQTEAYEYLVGNGEDRQTVYDTIQAIRAVENVSGTDEDGQEKRDILRDADMHDYSKALLYATMMSSGDDARQKTYEKLADAMDLGLTFDDCMDVIETYKEIDGMDVKPSVKAGRFAQWVDGEFDEQQAEYIMENYKYWQNLPAEPSGYDLAVKSGADLETAEAAREIRSGAEGKKDAEGNTIDGTEKAAVMRGIDALETDQATKLALMEAQGYNMKDYAGVSGFMSLTEYADAIESSAMATGKKIGGKTVKNSKRLEVMQEVNKMDYTPDQKTKIMQALGYKTEGEDTAPPIWSADYTGDYESYYYMSDAEREAYQKYCGWMDAKMFANAADFYDETGSIYGRDGKTLVTKQAQVIEYINALPLEPDQKTALYVAMGYNKSMTDKGFADCPWWNRLALRTEYYPG